MMKTTTEPEDAIQPIHDLEWEDIFGIPENVLDLDENIAG